MAENPPYTVFLKISVPGRRTGEPLPVPVRWGVPIPRGYLYQVSQARIVTPGVAGSLAVSPRAYWDDCSLRWILLHGVVELDSGKETTHCYRVEICEDPTESQLAFHSEALSGNGSASVDLRASREQLIIYSIHGGLACNLYVKHRNEQIQYGEIRDFSIIIMSDAVCQFSGSAVFRGNPKLHCTVSGMFYPSIKLLKFEVTLRNAARARHRHGLWDLGDTGSFYFREFGLELHLPIPLDAWWWCDKIGEKLRVLSVAGSQRQNNTATAGSRPEFFWHIYQASSGGKNWNSRNHINRHGRVTLPFEGYKLHFNGCEERGERASPVCCGSLGDGFVGVLIPYFWQEFPRRIAVDSRQIRLGLLAEQPADDHELQGGEQKTFEIWLSLAGRSPEAVVESLEAAACVTVEAMGHSKDLPELLAPLPEREELMQSSLAKFAEASVFGSHGLVENREVIDEFGWRHFGDVYADHEAAFYQGPTPVVSHYNNQFDLLLSCILHRWISGDRRYDELVKPLAKHVIDIDIYHTSDDRASFNNGLFWMTDHYKTVHTATHRAFSRFNAIQAGYGGGPSAEHNYTTGLLMYYFLWGDERAKEAVLGLANWVLAMEDGSRTPWFMLDDGPTGLATNTSAIEYHGPGRGAANSINALIDAFLVSGQYNYLEAAECLIRRTVHPDDDIESLNLRDAETRWSYTMYLESLAKFIRVKAMFNLVDEMYSYAIDSLLHYARWMAENEELYLQNPQKLKYPTEAWAAQEFRKATVLYCAAAVSEGVEQTTFREKARWFEGKAWEELLGFERPHNARVAAITMSQGIWHLALRKSGWQIPRLCHDTWRTKWPTREPFLPQRLRVRRMLGRPRGWFRLLRGFLYPPTLVRFIKLLWRWRN